MAAQTLADFNSIPDGPLMEILLRLDRLLSSAVVSSRWRGIASEGEFLEEFRKRHPSSPLLGVFAQGFVPIFHNVSSDPDLKAVVRYTDTALAYLGREYWCIEDCRNGRLLLSSDQNEICIYDPLSQLCVPIPERDDTAGKYVSTCLLDVNGMSSRQVVSVERRGKFGEAAVSYRLISVQLSGRDIRAVEYDPNMPNWHAHQWQGVSPLADDRAMPQWDLGAMYAGEHIFWRYRVGSLLVLDTTKMCFYTLILPGKLTFHHHLRYAIGEIEDGKGCLVCLQVPDAFANMPISHAYLETRLQVWLLEKKGADICWEFKEEVSVSKLLGGDARVWRVPTVINGLALISKGESGDQYVVDLRSMTRLVDVKFSGKGYLYQMPWPPTGLAATSAGSTPPLEDNFTDDLLSSSEVSERTSHDEVELVHEETETDGDECSKLSPSNRIKESPTSSFLGTTCFQSQHMDPAGDNEGSGDEAVPCDNYHALKTPVSTGEETGGCISDKRTMLTATHVLQDNTTRTTEVENSKSHLNSAEHDLGEKASLDLDGDSARIQPVEMDPSHEQTLQTAAVLPSVNCNWDIQEDKSEIDNLLENTTEGAEMFELQNCDKAHPEFSCANNTSEDHATWEDLDVLLQQFPAALAWGQAGTQEGEIVSDPVPPDRPGADCVVDRATGPAPRPTRTRRSPRWMTTGSWIT